MGMKVVLTEDASPMEAKKGDIVHLSDESSHEIVCGAWSDYYITDGGYHLRRDSFEIPKNFYNEYLIEYGMKKEIIGKKTDLVNPDHYKSNSKEVWEMMVDIWGVDAFKSHCEMTAFKYRMRMGKKEGQLAEIDLKKAEWYESKMKELF